MDFGHTIVTLVQMVECHQVGYDLIIVAGCRSSDEKDTRQRFDSYI